MSITNVLVGVDGSENSERALDFALDFAEKFGASLAILNVAESVVMGAVPPETVTYPTGGSSTAVVAKDLMIIQKEMINRYVAHAREVNPRVKVSALTKEGDAAIEIVDTAKEGFNVIVVGHRGLGRMSERFLGSVSAQVAHSAPCTVIIVK
ncbi:MAG: universal stress protein [Candidatus Bathyarchaeia archaeon]|jgi:nucleotide-binding universal stress UspA family protein